MSVMTLVNRAAGTGFTVSEVVVSGLDVSGLDVSGIDGLGSDGLGSDELGSDELGSEASEIDENELSSPPPPPQLACKTKIPMQKLARIGFQIRFVRPVLININTDKMIASIKAKFKLSGGKVELNEPSEVVAAAFISRFGSVPYNN